jgi:hypothetical protein
MELTPSTFLPSGVHPSCLRRVPAAVPTGAAPLPSSLPNFSQAPHQVLPGRNLENQPGLDPSTNPHN